MGDNAVLQNVGRKLFDVVRYHVAPAPDSGPGLGRVEHPQHRARTRAQLHLGVLPGGVDQLDDVLSDVGVHHHFAAGALQLQKLLRRDHRC